jgi:hypothetical protein
VSWIASIRGLSRAGKQTAIISLAAGAGGWVAIGAAVSAGAAVFVAGEQADVNAKIQITVNNNIFFIIPLLWLFIEHPRFSTHTVFISTKIVSPDKTLFYKY